MPRVQGNPAFNKFYQRMSVEQINRGNNNKLLHKDVEYVIIGKCYLLLIEQ